LLATLNQQLGVAVLSGNFKTLFSSIAVENTTANASSVSAFPVPNARAVKLVSSLQKFLVSLQTTGKKASVAEQLKSVLDIALSFLSAVDSEKIFAVPVVLTIFLFIFLPT
jgi:hypothetical protein